VLPCASSPQDVAHTELASIAGSGRAFHTQQPRAPVVLNTKSIVIAFASAKQCARSSTIL
jgi:hypothetical protein